MSSIKHILLFVFLFLLKTTFYSQSVGGITSGAQTYCDTSNSGFISLTGYVGNITSWQYSTNGGSTWINNGNTFNTQSYFNLKQSTCYRAIVKNGSFPSDTSTMSCIDVYAPSKGGTISGGGTFCGGSGTGTLNLIGSIGNVLKWQFSLDAGNSWTDISNSTTNLSYTNITQDKLYRAIVRNGATCPTDTSSIASFSIIPQTVAGSLNSVNTQTMCYGTSSNTINLSGNTGNVLYWISSTNNGASWNNISNNTTSINITGIALTTLFKAVVQNANCNIDTTNSLQITILPSFTVNAGKDSTIIQGQSIQLNGSGNGTPQWSPATGLNNINILNPFANPENTTYYILTITDTNSCSYSDTVLITVISNEFSGIVSSVFTPNGDGINDNWFIENIDFYPENEVNIYNIYGNIVYSKKGYKNDWQGTYNNAPLPDGTYYYILKIGESKKLIKGSVDIIRNK
ncbi:MAG TPA: gliding motility-associated C-terminal domain-containing protein [Bacteroidia bacterium]|nr:gliding motility-associated C-terminal domain-containing protein [Bacteroidia bacterium]